MPQYPKRDFVLFAAMGELPVHQRRGDGSEVQLQGGAHVRREAIDDREVGGVVRLEPRGDLGYGRDRLRIDRMGARGEVSVIEQAVEWPQGGRSLYFRDPAGNSLEVASPRIWGIDERAAIRPSC